MEKTMVKQAVLLQPMELNSGTDIHLQPVEDPKPRSFGFGGDSFPLVIESGIIIVYRDRNRKNCLKVAFKYHQPCIRLILRVVA
ncbi:AN1-type zinc finger protein 5-like [Grus japonensis]|uniref:AN1-type zinc finger protein 5-like n=1 Tax=Grus japonensis TaxID=30415 RepID=A0ABC9Y9D7_GRUJA